jgi:S-methylmethionine-dependent homocysteine/selenocysteine methylase
VRAIHRDHASAGAEVLTADTFRTQARTLAHAGIAGRARELTMLAVALAREGAREAAPERRIFVAGSLAPLEDCWHPERVPPDAALEREHREHAGHLAAAGVDLLLVETMNTVREARAALAAAAVVGIPACASFSCDESGRLLSGETLAAALDAVAPLEPAAVLVNCLPPHAADACLGALRASGRRFGVYPNLGAPDQPLARARERDRSPAALAAFAARWLDAGATLIGGCCGTTPEHVAAIAQEAAHR